MENLSSMRQRADKIFVLKKISLKKLRECTVTINIPMTLPITESNPGGLTPYQEKRRTVKAFLEGAGLYRDINVFINFSEREHKPMRLKQHRLQNFLCR